jgi:hypothetical protein
VQRMSHKYLEMRKARLLLACLMVVAALGVSTARAESNASLEYKVKAAFLYNFLKFVEWPADQGVETTAPITVGIVCNDEHANSFDEIATRKVKDRSIIIKKFADVTTPEAKAGLAKCQLIYVTASLRDISKDIIALTRKQPVLVVGESEGFIEAGGIINFVMQDNKVCFEINADSADEANLKIASQLLRLAKRVIKTDKSKSSIIVEPAVRRIGRA